MKNTQEGQEGVPGTSRRASLRELLGQVRSARIFDLDIGRFPGMPHHPAQPGFDIVTYLSPAGARAQRQRVGSPAAVDDDNFGVVLEVVRTSMHMGTHLDALSHVTAGADDHGFGGFSAALHVGDRGVVQGDVAGIAPILSRGVLLDVAGALGLDRLPPGHAITPAELELAQQRGDVPFEAGDVVLVRTGHLTDWPRYDFDAEPGLSVEAALWLAESGPLAVGADNSAIEVMPSVVPGRAQPVHVELIVERGIYLIEWVGLEELAAAGVHEFVFICLPLKIAGGTGSLVRPVAVA